MNHQQIEQLVDEIYQDKQQLDFFKEKTDKNIEALKIVQKKSATEKHWVNCGSLFIQMPNKNITESLKKDQKILYQDMKDLEKEMEIKKGTISKFNQY